MRTGLNTVKESNPQECRHCGRRPPQQHAPSPMPAVRSRGSGRGARHHRGRPQTHSKYAALRRWQPRVKMKTDQPTKFLWRRVCDMVRAMVKHSLVRLSRIALSLAATGNHTPRRSAGVYICLNPADAEEATGAAISTAVLRDHRISAANACTSTPIHQHETLFWPISVTAINHMHMPTMRGRADLHRGLARRRPTAGRPGWLPEEQAPESRGRGCHRPQRRPRACCVDVRVRLRLMPSQAPHRVMTWKD